jgi:hypothetical protein
MKARIFPATAITVLFATTAAFAGDFGSAGMQGRSNMSMELSPSAHSERICNGYFSSGKIVARINGGAPKNLPAGACLETYAQTMSIQNPQGGAVHIFFARSGKQNI